MIISAEEKLIQVYRVTKHYRNGIVTHHVIASCEVGPDAESELDDFAQGLAENWGIRNPAGQNYGYSLDVEPESDASVVKKVILDEIEGTNKQIKRHQDHLSTLSSIKL